GGRGHRQTAGADVAEVILLNTCAIREHAAERVIGRLGELARYKRRRPDVRLGVTGCMAQHLRERLRERAPHVDLLVGPDGYRRLPELLGAGDAHPHVALRLDPEDRKSTRLNSSHQIISYAVFCLKKKQ